MTGDDPNERILDLWYEPRFDLAKLRPRMPRVYGPLARGGLVTVGLNPSFSRAAFASFAPGVKPDELFGWSERERFDLVRAIEVDELAVREPDGYRNYYGDFWDLRGQLGRSIGAPVPWQHLDVFLLRTTSSKPRRNKQSTERTLSEWVSTGAPFETLTPFGTAQVNVCVELIKHVQPAVLVVPNADASRILERALGSRFDPESGRDVVDVGAGDVPVFYSGQWKGGGIDEFSLRHLKWRIEAAYRDAERAIKASSGGSRAAE